MNDMTTPIQQAIEAVKTQIAVLKEVQHAADAAPACIRILQNTLRHMESALPAEREAIEQAFNIGCEDALKGEFGGCPTYQNGSDYFNSTYDQP